jgi:DNA-directed RNA polymerase specialized sigma24 family protein
MSSSQTFSSGLSLDVSLIMQRDLKANHAADTIRSIDQEFLSRYETFVHWAMRFSPGNRSRAQELVHEAFVQIRLTRTSLSSISNLDGYFYSVLRNLSLAQASEETRRTLIHLSPLEFDSLASAPPTSNLEEVLEFQFQLRELQRFLCVRRWSIKGASILILRFFLGYTNEELSAITHLSQASLRQRLRVARIEGRDHLARLKRDHTATVDPLHALLAEDFVQEIRDSILGTTEGPCITRNRLVDPGITLTTEELAHLAGCRGCLARSLGNDDTEHADLRPPSSLAPDDHNVTVSKVVLIARTSMDMEKDPLRHYRETFSHQPRVLNVLVNGKVLASVRVNGHEHTLAVPVHPRIAIEFIEVVSDASVRLCFFSAEVCAEQGISSIVSELSEDRSLCLSLEGTPSGAIVRLIYRNSLCEVTAEPQQIVPFRFLSETTAEGVSTWSRRWRSFRDNLLVRPLSAALVATLIFVLIAHQINPTPLYAEDILKRADQWEERMPQGSADVLHRSFVYLETHPGQEDVRRHIDLWSRPAGHVRMLQVSTAEGKPLASTRLPVVGPVNLSTAWQLVPSPESVRSMVPDVHVLKVTHTSRELILSSSRLEMRLDAATFRPQEISLNIGSTHVDIRENWTENIPVKLTPLQDRPAAASAYRPGLIRQPTREELDESELEGRERLHALHADVGEDVRILSGTHEILVTGVLSHAGLRRQVEQALGSVVYLRTELRSADRALGRPRPTLRLAHVSTMEQSRPPLLKSWLEEHYPNDAEREEFISAIFSGLDDALAHSRALSELTARYPDRPQPRVLALEEDHRASINHELATLRQNISGFPDAWNDLAPQPDTPSPELQQLYRTLTLLLTDHMDSSRVIPESARNEPFNSKAKP